MLRVNESIMSFGGTGSLVYDLVRWIKIAHRRKSICSDKKILFFSSATIGYHHLSLTALVALKAGL